MEWFSSKQEAEASTAQKIRVLEKMNIGSTFDAKKELERTFSEIGLRQWLNTDGCLKRTLRQVFGFYSKSECCSCTNCINSSLNKPTVGEMLKIEIAATPNAEVDGRRNLVTPGFALPVAYARAPATPLATPVVNRVVNPYMRTRPTPAPAPTPMNMSIKRKFAETLLTGENPIVTNAKINAVHQQQSIDNKAISERFLKRLADECLVCKSKQCNGGCVSRANKLCENCFSRGHYRRQCKARIPDVLCKKGCFRCWRPSGQCDHATCKIVDLRLKAVFYLTAATENRSALELVQTIYNHEDLWVDAISKIASKYIK